LNLREMMDEYAEEGLTRALASSRVCQDIVLKALAEGPLSRNVTIKGGVVMRSLTKNNRRATSDIDLDFIHYSLDDEGATLLKNTYEQSFVEKLRSLLEFGANSRRYKDIFDMYYLRTVVSEDKMKELMDILIFDDPDMFENSVDDIVRRLKGTFKDEQYLKRVSESRQRWMDNEIHEISNGIVEYIMKLG